MNHAQRHLIVVPLCSSIRGIQADDLKTLKEKLEQEVIT
jgi:hypothetical protein